MKYKVGDKVRIKSIDWYNENKSNHLMKNCDLGDIRCGSLCFVPDMRKYCGKEAIITQIVDKHYGEYEINIDNGYWSWTDEMLEDEK